MCTLRDALPCPRSKCEGSLQESEITTMSPCEACRATQQNQPSSQACTHSCCRATHATEAHGERILGAMRALDLALRCGVVFIKMSVRGIMSLGQPVGERTPSWAQQLRKKKCRMRAWPARTAKPSHHQTPAALYYLRHLRSIAAAAHGCKA